MDRVGSLIDVALYECTQRGGLLRVSSLTKRRAPP
jgi:hypothetical protein